MRLRLANILRGRFARLRDDTDATATVELVFILPLFVLLLQSSLELGMITMRKTMLDHAVDDAVRMVRLGQIRDDDYETLKKAICVDGLKISNCTDVIRLEMKVIDPYLWSPMPAEAKCANLQTVAAPPPTDLYSPPEVPEGFEGGGDPKKINMIRACLHFPPYLPGSPIALALSGGTGGEDQTYRLISASAFVLEP